MLVYQTFWHWYCPWIPAPIQPPQAWPPSASRLSDAPAKRETDAETPTKSQQKQWKWWEITCKSPRKTRKPEVYSRETSHLQQFSAARVVLIPFFWRWHKPHHLGYGALRIVQATQQLGCTSGMDNFRKRRFLAFILYTADTSQPNQTWVDHAFKEHHRFSQNWSTNSATFTRQPIPSTYLATSRRP